MPGTDEMALDKVSRIPCLAQHLQMENKMNKSRIFVYVIMGIIGLAIIAAALIYLPGLMATLHGTG